jgi:hypothetical protein
VGDLLHLELCEFDIENIDVLGDAVRRFGPGNHDDALCTPAQDDLRGGLAVSDGHGGHGRIADISCPTEGTVRPERDATLA